VRITAPGRERGGLLGEALVALGRDAQLDRHRAVVHLDDQQLARAGLELADEAGRIVAAVNRRGDDAEHRARVGRRDRVERVHEQLDVGDPSTASTSASATVDPA